MRGTTKSTRTSFFLHIHPDRVLERTIAPATTLGLGALSAVLLVVLLVTGIVLMFWYVPAPGAAYDRIVDMSGGAYPLIGLMRDVHRLASDALVVVVVLHLLRVYLTGSLARPRRLNWLVGLGLLVVVVATAFTGFLLPWDRDAYWAATVGGELVGLVPTVGLFVRGLLWGGDTVCEDTVLRAYAFHVALLPSVGTVMVAYHLWRVRRSGGLARPESAGGTTRIPTRPHVTVRELILAVGAITILLAVALVWDSPLGPPGDPPRVADPAKAPWFLLWIQELVAVSAPVGGVVPLVLLALLAALPLWEREPEKAGLWITRGRRLRCGLMVATLLAIACLTVLAAWFRGPGWQLQL